MKKKLGLLVAAAAVFAFTAGTAVACSEVTVPPSGKKQYAVTYYYNYTGAPTGGVYKINYVDENTAVQKPANPTRANYTFDTWTTDTAGNTEYVFTTTVTGELKLYAQWKANSQQEATLTGITATVSKTYKVGDTFSKDDITVTAKYSDNTEKTVTDFTYTEPDMSVKGKKEITVTYNGKTDKVEITVDPAQEVERTLESIEATVSKTYKVGDTFNKSDITVTAKYSDKTEKTVTDFTYTAPVMSTAGPKQITVTYNDGTTTKTTTVNITVDPAQEVERTLESIEATVSKTYKVGDTFNKSDITVTAKYSDKTEKTVTDFTYTAPVMSTAGPKQITVTYNDGTTTKTTTVNITVNALESFAVTFDSNGGSAVAKQDVTEGELVQEPTAPSKKGYTFAGWYDDQTEYDFEAPVTGTLNLVAHWTAKEYDVHYDISNAANPATETYTAGSDGEFGTFALTAAPTKDHYTFDGWYLNSNCTGDKITELTYDDITAEKTSFTVYGKYVAETYEIEYVFPTGDYTAGFNSDYEPVESYSFGTGLAQLPTAEDITITSNDPATTYTFAGWLLEGESVGEISTTDSGKKVLTADITSETTYTVTYDLNYVGKPATPITRSVKEGNKAPNLTSYTRTGYTFKHWYETDPSSPYDFTNTTVTGNLTLKAHWEEKLINVTLDVKGGTLATGVQSPLKIQEGNTIAEFAEPTRTGYTFTGWTSSGTPWVFGEEGTKVTKEVTLTAGWTLNKYDLTYAYGNGTANSTSQVDYNKAISLAAAPTKTGYTFTGWSDGKDTYDAKASYTMPANAVTFTAQWVKAKYNVTYTTDGVSTDPVEVEYEATITLAAAPTKTGYTFTGWSDGKDTYDAGAEYTMPANAVTFTAQWVKAKYNVTYTTDGVSTDPVEVEYEATITLAAAPTKTGYTFTGWSDGKDTYDAEAEYTMPANAVEFTAQWVKAKYNVTYTTDGVSTDPVEVEYEATITLAAAPTKTGYTFTGWSDGKDTYDAEAEYTMPASAVTFTAQWTKAEYKVTYKDGETVIGTPTDEEYEATITLAAAPTKTGYTFTGWSDGKDTYDAEAEYTMPASAVTFTAQWTKAEYKVTYKDGETVIGTPTDEEYEATITLAAAPTKTGYTFAGWSDGKDTYDAEAEYTMPANAVTFTAQWTKAEYKVTYKDGETVIGTPTDEEYEATITLEAAPSKDGYTFTGWSDGKDTYDAGAEYTMPANAVTFTAQWSENEYTVEYYVDGTKNTTTGNATTYKITNGTVELDELEQDGYTFDGWYDNAEYNGTAISALTFSLFDGANANATVPLYAHFTLTEYSVTYNLDGGTNHADNPDTYTINDNTVTLQDPTKEGHTFGGWYTSAALTESSKVTALTYTGSNFTLYAKWDAVVKVDGIYSGDSIVKAFVVETEGAELAAKFFAVETASAENPFKVKIYVDNAAVTENTNITANSTPNVASSANGEISIKQAGIYSLYYKYGTNAELGVYVKRHCDVNDFVEPNIVAGDGVYVNGEIKVPFVFNNNSINQVMAEGVQVGTDDEETEYTIKLVYGGADVTVVTLNHPDNIAVEQDGANITLYAGTYDFYYNYAANPSITDETEGRLWIGGTQTGGPQINRPADTVAVEEINAANGAYLVGKFGDYDLTSEFGYQFSGNGAVITKELAEGDMFACWHKKWNMWLTKTTSNVEGKLEEVTVNERSYWKVLEAGTYSIRFVNEYGNDRLEITCPGEEVGCGWYIVGEFNGWGSSAGNRAYELDSNGQIEISLDKTSFKLCDATASNWIGNGNDNIQITEKAKYRITKVGNSVNVEKIGEYEAPAVKYNVYIHGNFGSGWASTEVETGVDAGSTITFTRSLATGEFGIKVTNAETSSQTGWGASGQVKGNSPSGITVNGGDDLKCTAVGNYKFEVKIDSEGKVESITITAA